MSDSPRMTPPPGRAASEPRRPFWGGDRLAATGLAAAVVAAYQHVWRAGFIWDDNGHVTRPDLRPLGGLWRIWFEPGATQQYYPVLHSAFWLEHRLWGNSAPAYHLANVALHLAVTWLLYRVLRRLSVPGALLGAALFALHPVCVESVAWVSEQKNTLSALFYLGAALAYLRFDGARRGGWYVAATLLFALAILTKSVTATLPAALLVVLWWRRGRISAARDVLPLAPWLVMGAAAGVVTAWMERNYIGASGASFSLGAAGRVIVAGRALWFYAGKLLWPSGLAFIYPRWEVDPRSAQWLFPAAAVAAFAALAAVRGRTRAPLAAGLLFAGTLFPALGFVNVYPFIYSYVADHFQYLAAAIFLSALAAGLTLAARGLPPRVRAAAGAAAAAALAVLTWRQCAMYADMRTLWLATLERNPDCWMARNNLAVGLTSEGRLGEAEAQLRRALGLNPGFADTHNNLGVALQAEGRTGEAIAEFQRALEIKADDVEAWNNLGKSLIRAGKPDAASAAYSQALQIEPADAEAEKGLGRIARLGRRMDEAAARYRRATEIDPSDVDAWNNLGNAYLVTGRTEEAIAQYRMALRIDPGYVEASNNLAAAFLKAGRPGDAIGVLQGLVGAKGGDADSHYNLGSAFLDVGRLDEAVAQFRKALELDPGDADAQRGLGTALFRQGHVDEALTHFNEAQRQSGGR
jgi:protein O-mannosyl-transferase